MGVSGGLITFPFYYPSSPCPLSSGFNLAFDPPSWLNIPNLSQRVHPGLSLLAGNLLISGLAGPQFLAALVILYQENKNVTDRDQVRVPRALVTLWHPHSIQDGREDLALC